MDTQAQAYNRLKHEKSPYLLQHADNPVDWYPWGDAAFEKAEAENKPILVSIGYSTCHWCHVMAKESFSDPDTAALMNRNFVNIKVDREERPDIDNIYITAVSAMTGSAGWPLNVFLTPDGRPFYGGTYFPPTRRANPSWAEILRAVAEAYHDPAKRKELLQSADKITALLKSHLAGNGASVKNRRPGPEALDGAVDAVSGMYDDKHGGFGSSPKFPMPPIIKFLLFYSRFDSHTQRNARKSGVAMAMATHSLEEMAAGGIYDHLGGGFHRYATDAAWHVPHFEKMLYDNAQLILLYADAYEMTGNEAFATVAKEATEYVLRDMTHPAGGFYSAEDADSVNVDVRTDPGAETAAKKKAEGGFYVWRHDEIMHILKEEPEKALFEVFAAHYGIKPEGNVSHDPLGEFSGKNILHRVRTIEDTAKRFDRSEGEIEKVLSMARQRLFSARDRRPRPHLDDKILVEWNGLMISALAAAYRVFGDKRYLIAADSAISFIYENMYEEGEKPILYRRWRDGERKIPAMAADYAYLIQGLLDVYEAGFDVSRFEWAAQLTDQLLERFYDDLRGGFYTTGDDQDKHLLLKAKDVIDNVMPSVDAVGIMNCMRLHRYTGHDSYYHAADRTLAASMDRAEKQPAGVPSMLTALGVGMLRHAECIVVGSHDPEKVRAMMDVIRSRPREAVSLAWIRDDRDRDVLAGYMPHVAHMHSQEDAPAVFVCFDQTCREAVSDPESLGEILDAALESPVKDFMEP